MCFDLLSDLPVVVGEVHRSLSTCKKSYPCWLLMVIPSQKGAIYMLRTTNLVMIQRDDDLVMTFYAQCSNTDNNDNNNLTTCFVFCKLNSSKVIAVMDSSLYFVIDIVNPNNNKRRANIGVGCQDRNDAMNFKMGLQENRHSMSREKRYKEMMVMQ